MLRVLYLIDSMTRNGTQSHIANMVRWHDRRRFRPYVLCLQGKGDLGRDLEAEGHPVASYGLKRIYASKAVGSYPGYVRFLKKERINVVHAYLFAAQVYGIPGARLAGVPLVIAGRRNAGVYWQARKYVMARRISNALAHIQIANSHAVKEFIVEREGVPPEQVRVVYNGVDADRFAPPSGPHAGNADNTLTVGYVGSITRIKRVDFLLRATARLIPKLPGLRLLVVGGGPGQGLRRNEGETDRRLTELVRDLGLAGHLTFLSPQSRVEDEMKKMDLFVMPSVSEGMSNAILEAMATGLPVLATDCGANREVIIDGKTGHLFPCDDEKRLGELILNLLQDTGERLRMGQEARKRILERFTIRRMVEEMERVYVEELTCEKK